MTPLLLSIHDWVRWAVLGMGVLSAVWTGVTWIRSRPVGPLDQRLSMAFVGLLDLQWLLGIAVFILKFSAPDLSVRIFHGGVMTVAVFAAHLVRIRARGAMDQDAPPHLVVGALLPLLIIALGLRLW